MYLLFSSCVTATVLIIISAKNVMFLLVFVCLSVYLSVCQQLTRQVKIINFTALIYTLRSIRRDMLKV